MRKQQRTQLLAIALVIVVGLLGLHAALHWHGPDYDNCQACHSGRVAISRPAVQLPLKPPVPVARLAPPEAPLVDLGPVCTHHTPRAPPA
jgi:hypothetical protein